MSFDVSVALKNVHDFEAVRDIAKKDHIILVGNAADVRAKLRTRTAYVPSIAASLWHWARSFLTKAFPAATFPLASVM
jgi:hypothetical protein